MVYKVFNNIFFTGKFEYAGETYQGVHKPMITEEEYDLAQKLLGSMGKPHMLTRDFAYTNWIKCTCGSSITAEERFKKWCYECKRKVNSEKKCCFV